MLSMTLSLIFSRTRFAPHYQTKTFTLSSIFRHETILLAPFFKATHTFQHVLHHSAFWRVWQTLWLTAGHILLLPMKEWIPAQQDAHLNLWRWTMTSLIVPVKPESWCLDEQLNQWKLQRSRSRAGVDQLGERCVWKTGSSVGGRQGNLQQGHHEAHLPKEDDGTSSEDLEGSAAHCCPFAPRPKVPADPQ